MERLGVWCEFLPYAQVLEQLPVLAQHGCDLIVHVGQESFSNSNFPLLIREAAHLGVHVDAWLLLPYEDHLYVGQASLEATRHLARKAADFFESHQLPIRAFVFDCEPSPLLGAELFAAVRAKSPRQLAALLRREMDPHAFHRDTRHLNDLVTELRQRGYAVDGAANRAFLDAQARGNLALEDALNAPVSGVGWDSLSFITYRYKASRRSYAAMVNRYAALARRLYGDRAALDLGLIGHYSHIPENAERARLFGAEEFFHEYLSGMTHPRDLELAVSMALSRGVRRINLYALDGAVVSEAGLDAWLAAARRARPLPRRSRWTPARSLWFGALGAVTEKSFRWMTGGSEKTHGPIEFHTPPPHPRQRQP